MKLSVRGRITVFNVAVMALVLALFALAVRYVVQVSLFASVDADLAERARQPMSWWAGLSDADAEWARQSRRFRPPDRRGRDHRRGRGFRQPPVHPPSPSDPDYWRWPRMLNPAGTALFGPGRVTPLDRASFQVSLRGAPRFTTTQVAGEPARVFSAPLRRHGRIEGVVQVVQRLTDLRRLLRRLATTILALIPLALLIAGFGGAFLANRTLHPVREITHAAAQITAEDLSRRLPESGHDEFGELASTFNALIGRVETAFRELEDSYQQQRRFTADASHELRTPLTTMKANTSLALAGTRSAESYREALVAADGATDTMHRIVQDLLLLARSDNGQMELEVQPVSVSELLDRAAGSTRNPTGSPVRVLAADPEWMVLGDPHHLTRLFVNLFENAVRHTPANGRVEAAVSRRGSTIVVEINDTGEGIPPEHLPHVLERFYRVDPARSRARGGTGLGLSICQSILQAHHGSLSLRSSVGSGTTVTVTLPAA